MVLRVEPKLSESNVLCSCTQGHSHAGPQRCAHAHAHSSLPHQAAVPEPPPSCLVQHPAQPRAAHGAGHPCPHQDAGADGSCGVSKGQGQAKEEEGTGRREAAQEGGRGGGGAACAQVLLWGWEWGWGVRQASRDKPGVPGRRGGDNVQLSALVTKLLRDSSDLCSDARTAGPKKRGGWGRGSAVCLCYRLWAQLCSTAILLKGAGCSAGGACTSIDCYPNSAALLCGLLALT